MKSRIIMLVQYRVYRVLKKKPLAKNSRKWFGNSKITPKYVFLYFKRKTFSSIAFKWYLLYYYQGRGLNFKILHGMSNFWFAQFKSHDNTKYFKEKKQWLSFTKLNWQIFPLWTLSSQTLLWPITSDGEVKEFHFLLK